jgi:hypothetical protein
LPGEVQLFLEGFKLPALLPPQEARDHQEKGRSNPLKKKDDKANMIKVDKHPAEHLSHQAQSISRLNQHA